MKKIGLLLSSYFILAVVLTGTGCVRSTSMETGNVNSNTIVTHIVMREVNPELISDKTAGDKFNIYLSDQGSRAEISEIISVSDLPPDTTTIYVFSDPTARMEYMFIYPNTIAEAQRAELPVDHPLKQGDNVITALDMSKRLSSDTDASLIELLLQPILTIPLDQIQSSATEPYIITDIYTDELYDDRDAQIERRATINPKTNLPTLVQLVDISSGETIESFVIEEYTVDDDLISPANFFTLEDWKESLPGENHLIIEDDITQ